jgi:hypothetical protein
MAPGDKATPAPGDTEGLPEHVPTPEEMEERVSLKNQTEKALDELKAQVGKPGKTEAFDKVLGLMKELKTKNAPEELIQEIARRTMEILPEDKDDEKVKEVFDELISIEEDVEKTKAEKGVDDPAAKPPDKTLTMPERIANGIVEKFAPGLAPSLAAIGMNQNEDQLKKMITTLVAKIFESMGFGAGRLRWKQAIASVKKKKFKNPDHAKIVADSFDESGVPKEESDLKEAWLAEYSAWLANNKAAKVNNRPVNPNMPSIQDALNIMVPPPEKPKKGDKKDKPTETETSEPIEFAGDDPKKLNDDVSISGTEFVLKNKNFKMTIEDEATKSVSVLEEEVTITSETKGSKKLKLNEIVSKLEGYDKDPVEVRGVKFEKVA